MSVFYTIFFVLSIFIIIQLRLAPLPIFDQTRITVQVGLITVILAIILSLCAAQCIGIDQVRQGIGSYAASDQHVPFKTDDVQMISSSSSSLKCSCPCMEVSTLEKYSSTCTFTFSPPLTPFPVHSPHQHVNESRGNGPREIRSLRR